MPGVQLGNGVARAALGTGGGVLARFDVRSGGRWRAVLTPARGPGPTGAAAFPMVPWCNRLSAGGVSTPDGVLPIAPNWPTTPYPVHGTGWLADWQVVHRTPHRATLRLREHGGAPYRFHCDLTAALRGTCLSLSLRVTNTGPSALPFGMGWHPYVPRPPGTTLRLRASRGQGMDGRGLPMPERAVSPPFDFRHPRPLPRRDLSVSYPAPDSFDLWRPGGFHVACRMSGAECCLLWSPADSDFLCIEPMSHRVDAFSSPEGARPHLLAPGSAMDLCLSISAGHDPGRAR